MAAGAPIHEIPEKIGVLATSVSSGGRAVTRAFVDNWFGPPEQSQAAYLCSADCNFRLVLTKSQANTILFFFREQGPTKVVLDANVSFQIKAASDQDPPTAFTTRDVGVRFILPSFLIGFPSRADLDRFGFGSSSTDVNTMLFALGPEGKDFLAIMNAEAGKKAQVRYSPGGIPGPVEPQRGAYSLNWVLSFIRTLASWIESDLRAGNRVPAPLVEADEQSVPGVLFYLVGAYVNASNLVSQPGDQIFELPDIFQKTYFVNEYKADLKMRLASDGKLSDSDDYDTFQLTLRLMVRHGSQRMAEITAIPSDLAVSSALTASFTAALEFNVQAEVWGTLLDIEPAFVPLFFESARSDVLAFRIARDQYADTDVVVLRGMLAGQQSTVVLSARFIVDMSKAPPDVDVNPDSVEILAKVQDGDDSKVDFDTVKFLLHYVANFRRWMGVLG